MGTSSGMEVRSMLLDGRYRLVERLGAGGMAVVMRGYDEVLGRQVAIKLLAPELSADEIFRRRLRIEAQAAARLCHPHITNVYDYGEADDMPYVVMELIDGESLAAHLSGGTALPWREAVAVCAEVAGALATAHARGVVHRDVTPGNVMLTAVGAKVLDFGISALVGETDDDFDGSLLGTPAYLAPERLDGGVVSPATDVYALGVLLYRALSGRLPWRASTTTEILTAHRCAAPEPMPPVAGLPDDVADLCRRCLAKCPEDRPTSAEVAVELADVVGIRPVSPAGPLPGAPGLDAGIRTTGAARGGAGSSGDARRGGGRSSGDLRRRAELAAAETAMLPPPAGPGSRRHPAQGFGLAGRFGKGRDRGKGRDLGRNRGLGKVGGFGFGFGFGSGRRAASAGRPILTHRRAGAGAPARPRAEKAIVAAGALTLTAAMWAVYAGAPEESPSASGRSGGGPAPQAHANDCRVDYQVRRDTGANGRTFAASVTVTNTGPEAVRNWRLEFAFPAEQVLTRAAGDWRQSGRDVIVRPDAKRPPLAPGASTTFTIAGRHTGRNPLPVAFDLNGSSCQAVVSVTGLPFETAGGGPAGAGGVGTGGPGSGGAAAGGPASDGRGTPASGNPDGDGKGDGNGSGPKKPTNPKDSGKDKPKGGGPDPGGLIPLPPAHRTAVSPAKPDRPDPLPRETGTREDTLAV